MALSPIQQAIQDFFRDVYYSQTNTSHAVDISQYSLTQFDPKSGTIDPSIIMKHQPQSHLTPQTPQETGQHSDSTVTPSNVQDPSLSGDIIVNRQPLGNDASDSMVQCATERIEIFTSAPPMAVQSPYGVSGEFRIRDKVIPKSQTEDEIFDQLLKAYADAFSNLDAPRVTKKVCYYRRYSTTR